MHSDRIVVLNHNVVSHKRVCVHKIHNRKQIRNRLELGNLLSAGNFLKKAINLQKDFDLKLYIKLVDEIFKEHSLHSYQFWHLGDEKTKKLTAPIFSF